MQPRMLAIEHKGSSQYNQSQQSLDLYLNYDNYLQILTTPTSPHQIPTLKHLHLQHCKITNQTLQIITSLPWPVLTILQLRNNLIGDDGVRSIVGRKWGCLVGLGLGRNWVGVGGIGVMVVDGGFWGQGGEVLVEMDSNVMGKGLANGLGLGLQNLYNIPNKICKLNLSNNNLSNPLLTLLKKLQLPFLNTLNLNNTNLTNTSTKHLSKLIAPNLTHIEISRNCFGLDGFLGVSRSCCGFGFKKHGASGKGEAEGEGEGKGQGENGGSGWEKLEMEFEKGGMGMMEFLSAVGVDFGGISMNVFRTACWEVNELKYKGYVITNTKMAKTFISIFNTNK